jgi:type I restriction enzyme S subunit
MTVDWPILSLKEAGVTLIDCDHRTPPAASTGFPYVTIPQMRDGEVDLRASRQISPSDFTEWTKKALPQPNDVLLSRRCNPGETATVREGQIFAVGQNLVLLRADGKNVAPSFLRWMTKGPAWWSEVEKYRNPGAVFDSLKCRDIIRFQLPVPPLSVQHGISDLLSALDDKIELNRRMAETLEAIARALFGSWFVDFDPVRAKAEGRPTGLPDDLATLFPVAFGEDGSPLGWVTRNLIDDFRVTMGQSPPGSTYNENGKGVPFYQGRTDFGFRFPTRRVFCTAPTRIARRGDTLLSVRAPVGDINMADEECCLGRGVAALRHNSGSSSFTYYAVQVLQPAISSFNDDGTVFGAINRKQLEKIRFINPPSRIVNAFHKSVEPLDERIALDMQQVSALATLRDTLHPKLISGELRIADAEKRISAA